MIRRFLAFICSLALVAAVFALQPSFGFTVGKQTEPNQIAVSAQDLQLVCPGPVFMGSRTNVSKFSQVGIAKLSAIRDADAATQAHIRVFGSARSDSLAPQGNFVVEHPVVLSASATDAYLSGSALMAAAQMQKVSADWAQGLVGASCQRPSSQHWLVGGDTSSGRESLLVLVNPTNVDATVEISLLTPGGQITAPGLSGVSVPKRQTTIIPINGVAPATSTFAVRVEARGGRVGAWLQQRAVRGTKAAGIDLISPAAEGSELVIPGFFVRGSKDAQTLMTGSASYSDLKNIVRVVNPGSKEATVLVRVIGATSKTFGTVIQQKIPASSVTDIEVSGISDGDYAIFIASDVPVLASAKLNRTALNRTPVTDFTWLSSLAGASGTQVMVVPPQGISKISLGNASKESVRVSVRNGATTFSIDLSGGSTQTLTLAPGLLQIQSELNVVATIITDIDGTVTNYPMVEYRNLGGVVSVYVQ